MEVDLTKPIETVPCARNPEPVACVVVDDGRVVILDLWIGRDGNNKGAPHEWGIDATTGHFLNLDGAVRNVAPKEEATLTHAQEIAGLVEENARLREALSKVMPIRVHNGPDYAEVYFADGVTHSTQAMTMNPQDWLDIAAALERKPHD